LFLMIATTSAFAEDASKITGPVHDPAKGIDLFTVTSPFLKGPNQVDVLLPDKLEPGRRYRTLYVLPAAGEFHAKPEFGNGLSEMRKLDAQNRYHLICVMMSFDGSAPWYGANATDPCMRHEDYVKQVVVPLIESHYPTTGNPADRLLIGFSKSGWGAMTLLLRSPDFFGSACSWDAPLMMTEKNPGWGSKEHFGTPEQMAKYLPTKLAEEQEARFSHGEPRITILGHDLYESHTVAYHELLFKLGIKHNYDDSLHFKHAWDSGWLPKALEIFLGSPDLNVFPK